jgi:hypothetical protein
MRDLCGTGEITDAMRQAAKDEDRLALLERRHGLAIIMQAVEPSKRRYWSVVERNIAVEIEALRAILFPEEAALIRRNEETQRILADYNEEYLWSLIP